jgi:hypothetical protein
MAKSVENAEENIRHAWFVSLISLLSFSLLSFKYQTLRSRLQTCSGKNIKRYGAGCKPAPAKNIKRQKYQTLRSRLQTCSGKKDIDTVLDGVCNPVRNVSSCAGRGLQPRPAYYYFAYLWII